MIILGLAESFKKMSRPDPNQPWRSLKTFFSEIIKDMDAKFGVNLNSSLQFELLQLKVNIYNRFETTPFSAMFSTMHSGSHKKLTVLVKSKVGDLLSY